MGYEICRFKNSNINQEFICAICYGVFQEPLVIESCDHIFCAECILRWITEQGNCPIDRTCATIENLQKPLRSFTNLLNDMEIKCDFSENGCEQYIKLGELTQHISNCTANPDKPCGCGQRILKDEMSEHQNNCVFHLKTLLKQSLDSINELNGKLNKTENELKVAKTEITISSEWKSLKNINIIESNMPHIMKDKIITQITESLNAEIFDSMILCEKFNHEFGGNWRLFVGHQMAYNRFNMNNFLSFKIGKFNGFLYMNVRPVYDVLILEKVIKAIKLCIEKKVCDDELINSWTLVFVLTDDSFNFCEKFLEKNGLKCFIECINAFPYNNGELFQPMFGTLANISVYPQLRSRLMVKELIKLFVDMLSHQSFTLNYFSSYVLSNLLSEGKEFWKQNLTKDAVIDRKHILSKLKSKITELKLNSVEEFKLNSILEFKFHFTSFKPYIRLLKSKDKIPPEVQYFCVWTLTYFMRKDCKRYSLLLKEDNCIEVLENLIEDKKTEEYVRDLAKFTLNLNELSLND